MEDHGKLGVIAEAHSDASVREWAIRDEFYAADFLAAFPCRECVDALLGQLRQRKADGTMDLDESLNLNYVYRYESRAAEIIKRFHLKGNDVLKDYLRARKPQQYSSKHLDIGTYSCNTHDDIAAVEFPEF